MQENHQLSENKTSLANMSNCISDVASSEINRL